MNDQIKNYRDLFMEMEAYEKRGVGIFMNNAYVSPLTVADACAVHEECTYMRDYITEGGAITEIHFNPVSCITC